MREHLRVAAICAVLLSTIDAASGLEKRPVLDNSPEGDSWAAGATCALVYWNRCTLWGYSWSGFGDKALIGVCTARCCNTGGVVVETRHWFFTSAPQGWGFTGTIALTTVDENCCPGGTLASKPFLPQGFPAVVAWAQPVPAEFAVVMTLEDADGGIANPAGVASDHPAAGPTGPQACGFCYPINRVNHSYAWGSVQTPICPGSPFFDGVCNAQLRWSIFMNCEVSVEEASWGAIKSLYR